jgi:hypothetical protein
MDPARSAAPSSDTNIQMLVHGFIVGSLCSVGFIAGSLCYVRGSGLVRRSVFCRARCLVEASVRVVGRCLVGASLHVRGRSQACCCHLIHSFMLYDSSLCLRYLEHIKMQ